MNSDALFTLHFLFLELQRYKKKAISIATYCFLGHEKPFIYASALVSGAHSLQSIPLAACDRLAHAGVLYLAHERQSTSPWRLGRILKLSQVCLVSTLVWWSLHTFSAVKFSQFTQPFTSLIAIIFLFSVNNLSLFSGCKVMARCL